MSVIKTISEIVNIGFPRNYIKDNSYPMIGIEVEVENISYDVNAVGWDSVADGSLRNHGREFVSVPHSADSSVALLEHLFKKLNEKNEPDFSNRTSVHVHLNVLDMTPKQVQTMTLLYLVAERLIYKFVGKAREESIYCVPLYASAYYDKIKLALSANGVATLRRLSKNWHKYSGYNMCPITTQGTVEFRHMYGTSDISVLKSWINLIVDLRNSAINNKRITVVREITSLNTNSEYYSFLMKYFPNSIYMFDLDNLLADMEDLVAAIKYYISSEVVDASIDDQSLFSKLTNSPVKKNITLSNDSLRFILKTHVQAFDQEFQEIQEPIQPDAEGVW